jgi:tetratricopeptide (TPR) repeat protein
MNEIKIILSGKNLVFEVKNNIGTDTFKENFNPETLPGILKNYLGKIYNGNSFSIGKDFIKAVKNLEKLPNRVISVKSDCQWRRDNSPLEYLRLENQAKVTSNIDLRRNFKNENQDKYPDQKPVTGETSFSVIESLKENLKINPDNAEANFKLGVAFLSQKNYQEAIDCLREATSLDSANPDYFYNLGCAYQESGRLALAIAEYKETIQLDHNNYMAFYKTGLANTGLGKFHEAIPYFHESIIINPNFTDAYLKVGEVYNQLEYYKEAIFIFEEVLSFEPDNQEARKNLNQAYEIKKRLEATELNNIGIAYAEKGNFEKATEKFKKALSLNPDDAEIHYNLGLSYQKQDLLDEAIVQFKQVLKIDPGLEDVHLSLGDIYKAQKRYEQAISEYETLLQKNPASIRKKEILDNIAAIKPLIRN